MNNSEYLKQLAARGDGSLQEWFDAERVESVEIQGETDELTDSFMDHVDYQYGELTIDGAYFEDSREKLEADLRREIREYAGEFYEGEEVLFALILAMFDRQAAITRATESHGWRMAASGPIYEYRQERDLLRAELDEVKAERDALASDLAECDENRIEFRDQRDHAEEMLAQMEKERDYWKLHTDCWADKYRDMRTSRDCFKERAKRNEDKAKNYQRQLSKAERYGTIWPRYGDGAPMEVGDEAVGHYGKSEITSVKFHGNDVFIGFKWGGRPDGFTTDAKRVGRPPLVASDGKPILKGETLYGLSDSKAWTVTGFDRTRPWSVWAENDGGCKCLKPEWLAHEKPQEGARAEKIAALEAENAELREKLGEAIGHAHEIGKLVDLEARAG